MRINPFLQTLEIPVHRVRKRDVPEWKESLSEGEYFEVESIHFARVYRGKDKEDKMKIILSLSPSAIRLYTWMQYYIPRDSDEIRINDNELCSVLGISDRQVQRARLELVNAAIIYRKKENVYWVNPRYLCSGSRIKMYPDNKRIVSHAVEEEYVAPTVMQSLTNKQDR